MDYKKGGNSASLSSYAHPHAKPSLGASQPVLNTPATSQASTVPPAMDLGSPDQGWLTTAQVFSLVQEIDTELRGQLPAKTRHAIL